MFICIQCAMKALVTGGQPPFEDVTPEEHMRRYHPDPVATWKERRELEAKVAVIIANMKEDDSHEG